MEHGTKVRTKPYLGRRDFCELFDCGRSKAFLLMHEIGVIYIGRNAFVKAEVLERYLEEEGAINITWPKNRKAGRS